MEGALGPSLPPQKNRTSMGGTPPSRFQASPFSMTKLCFPSTACECRFSLYHFWRSPWPWRVPDRPLKALGGPRRRKERTLLLTRQGIVRMATGADQGTPLGGPEINLLGPLGERFFRKSAFFIKLVALLKPSYSLSETHLSAKEGRRK